jgi:ATP-dependent DNA helicase Q4
MEEIQQQQLKEYEEEKNKSSSEDELEIKMAPKSNRKIVARKNGLISDNFVKLNMKRNGRYGAKNRRFKRSRGGGGSSMKDLEQMAELQEDEPVDEEIEEPVVKDTKRHFTINHSLEELLDEEEGPALLLKLTQKHFSSEIQEFRNGQLACMQHILRRESTLVILPTGTGKSLCYQLPALLLTSNKAIAEKKPSIVLVISPLISLMTDQLQQLSKCLPGAMLSVNQTPKERERVISDIERGVVRVLFISPERLCSDSFLERLFPQDTEPMIDIAFACVDEAHCVSEWSHNFRPSYLHVRRVLQDRLQVKTMLGLTGTATKATEESIKNLLNMRHVIRAPLNRENLIMTMSRGDPDPFQAVLNLLKSERFKKCHSIVIYTMQRSDAEQLANHLQLHLVDAVCYHAGLTPIERKTIQDKFISNKTRIIVATVAFGMGINKPDISAVIHFNLPRSPENYIQEIGRAGRDGKTAQCHAIIRDEDYVKLYSLSFSDAVDLLNVKRLLNKIFANTPTEGPEYIDRAFNIHELGQSLDLKREVIITILTYLELQDDVLKVMSNMNHRYTVYFMKTHPKDLAKQYDIVRVILEENSTKKKSTKTEQFEFDIDKIAPKLQVNLEHVENSLLMLRELREIKYESKEEAFCVRVNRQRVLDLLSEDGDDEFSDICTKLADKMKDLEKIGLSKLQGMYDMAVSHLISDVDSHKVDRQQAKTLQHAIDQYFCETTQKPSTYAHNLIKHELSDLERSHMNGDMSTLLRRNGTSMIPNGKVLARILHGISTPAYNVQQWGSCGCWGRYKTVDYNELNKIAVQFYVSFKSKNQ